MLQITIHQPSRWSKTIIEKAYNCVENNHMTLPQLSKSIGDFSELMKYEYASFPEIDLQIINNCLLVYADLNHVLTFKTEL